MERRYCNRDGACPLAYNELSEQVQNYGCLPTAIDIVVMKYKYNRTWACHSTPTKPCLGGLKILKHNKLPYKVEGELLTEQSDWHNYVKVSEEELSKISKLLRTI